MAPIPQFKVRKINGITEIKLPDDAAFRDEFARTMRQYAPLLSEHGTPAPSFDELKSDRRVSEYVDAQRGAGRSFTFMLEIRAEGEKIIGKQVLLIDTSRKICAACIWKAGEGTSFQVRD